MSNDAQVATHDAEVASHDEGVVYLDKSDADYPIALKISDALRHLVDVVGKFACWALVPLVLVTAFDVILRKSGYQYELRQAFGPVFESTLLQETEWHLHTFLFALVLGFGYIYNTHVRVDLIRETLSFRKKAWMEFLGLTFFLIPFCVVVIYFAGIYAYDSWAINEISASQVGLPHRWIIKTILTFGLVLALFAGIAVWLQVVILLWGPQNIRFPLMTIEWPEEAGNSIEGKTRLNLDDLKEDKRIYNYNGDREKSSAGGD